MKAIKYLEEQLPKIDRFRREPLQIWIEFWDETWRCCYGWLEPYDGPYQLDFLHQDGSVFEGVIEALVRDTERYVAMVNEFLNNHRPYRHSSDPNEAIYAQLAEEGIVTHKVTDIQTGKYHSIRWRMNGHRCAGSQESMEQFWVKTGET